MSRMVSVYVYDSNVKGTGIAKTLNNNNNNNNQKKQKNITSSLCTSSRTLNHPLLTLTLPDLAGASPYNTRLPCYVSASLRCAARRCPPPRRRRTGAPAPEPRGCRARCAPHRRRVVISGWGDLLLKGVWGWVNGGVVVM